MTACGDRLLVVGAGLAAVELVGALRDGGWDGPITIVGDEPHAPYSRPPLSKGGLAGQLGDAELALRADGWYVDHGVELVLGEEVVDLGLHRDGSGRARGRSGRVIAYDRLVLATGAEPRRLPGFAATNVLHLRTRADADVLRPLLEPGRHLVVVGAGFIGLEVAAAARAAGCHVTVLEAGPQVLGRVASAPVAEHVAQWHAASGTELVTGAVVTGLETAGGRVRAVRSSDGRVLPADVVVVGIGAEPRTRLAADAGLRCDGGVVVDATQRASDGRTLAIGDCALAPAPGEPERLLRLESVDSATRGAAVAAATILGAEPPPGGAPWFWSDQGLLKVQAVGLPRPGDDQVLRRVPGTNRLCCIHLRDGVVVAAEAVDAPADFVALRKAVAGGLSLDRSALADGSLRLGPLVARGAVAVG